MTRVSGLETQNLLNNFKFSNCSIAQFKKVLLTSNGEVADNAQCLKNVPLNLEIETGYFKTLFSGQLWTADDQCRLIIGPNSTANDCYVTFS
jgi:hypothetical protein